ncbi:hypothetical protein MMC09_000541 [Bachmanniomyces sp. S44760]|nr:hypothetical protein [Bachmanniomyces sp. S44760]
MVKIFESSFSYDYSFPAVSLAYFLRYPNPFSIHVLSTDVINRTFDPSTSRLSTTRLHLKQSKVPPYILKLLPKGILGGTNKDGGSQSYILEKSVVDIKEGWMTTESRNLEWTGILSVIEKQIYTRMKADGNGGNTGSSERVTGREKWERSGNENVNLLPDPKFNPNDPASETTDVMTIVTFKSRFGQLTKRKSRQETNTSIDAAIPEPSSSSTTLPNTPDILDPPAKKPGFFATWSTSSLQRTIETFGMRRTKDAVAHSKQGMNVVLKRLRKGGLGNVLEGMRRDRDAVDGNDVAWKRVWKEGIGDDYD